MWLSAWLPLLLPASVWALPPVWTQLCNATCGAPPPGPLGYTAVVHANRLVVFGNNPPTTNAVYALPLGPPAGNWTELCPRGGGACGLQSPPARRGAMTGLIGGALYIYGGADGSTTSFDDVWRLDLAPATPVWAQLCATSGAAACGSLSPPRRGFGGAAVVGTRLYVFGGDDGATSMNGLHYFDTTAPLRWTNVCSTCQPPPRSGPGLVYDAATNRLLLFGGQDTATNTLYNDLWQFTPGGTPSSWRALPPATGTPLAVYTHGLAILPGTRLLVAVFGQSTTAAFPPLQAYDLDTQAWTANLTTAGPEPPPRCCVAAATDGAGLVMLGGMSTGVFFDVWRLTPVADPPPGPAPRVAPAVIVGATVGGAAVCGGGVLVALKLALKGGLTGAAAAQRRAAKNTLRDQATAEARAELADAEQGAPDGDGPEDPERSMSGIVLSGELDVSAADASTVQ